MSAATYTVLTEQEDRTLLELRLAQTVPQRTRDRAPMIRLNAQHWSVSQIAKIFECHRAYGATLRRWELHGLGGLWKVLGSGAKPKGQEAIYSISSKRWQLNHAPTTATSGSRSWHKSGK